MTILRRSLDIMNHQQVCTVMKGNRTPLCVAVERTWKPIKRNVEFQATKERLALPVDPGGIYG